MKKKRFFIIGSVGLVLGVVSFFLFPKILSFLSKNDVRADIPRVKGISDDIYPYEFSASSYKMKMGELGGNPNLLVSQNSKEMEVTVFEGQVLQEIYAPEDKGEVQESASDSAALTVTPSPTFIPTPTEIPSENLTLPDGLELINYLQNRSTVNAQTQVDTSSSSLDLVDTDTESSVVYINKDLKVDPKLDKVDLSFGVNEGFDLPSLYLDLKKLELSEDEEGVTVKTRTGRNVFAYRNAILTDANGTKIDIDIIFDQAGDGYLVSFEGYESWLNDSTRTFPVTLDVALVSLFAERMLPFWPMRETFKSFEPLVFEVDTAIVPDMEVQRALISDKLEGLRLGTIDSNGQQEILNAKVVSRDGEKVTLELTSNKFKPGIFDLLIQYQSNPAYIAQDDFSWGVLAINPDMSVYPVGTLANLDMAVLDKHGEMVCDAELLLNIVAPDGRVTEMSTLNKQIRVSDTCHVLMTDKPDYQAKYQTTVEGDYKMTLSALTKDGTFTIEDNFRVDSASPFYVRRLGPTRIYPKIKYDMTLEVTNATSSGNYKINEFVPVDFAIDPLQDGQTKVDENRQALIWNVNLLNGEKESVKYTFDAPDVSPELFLLGPIEISFQPTNDQQQTTVWIEPRQWQIASDAIGIENVATPCGVANSNSCNLSLTVTSATLIVVQVGIRNTATVSTVNDGNAYSNIHTQGSGARVEQWYYNNPTSGSKTITITTSGNDYWNASAFGLTGTDTTTPFQTTNKSGSSGSGTSASTTINVQNSTGWISSVVSNNDNGSITENAAGGQVQRWENIQGGGPSTRVGTEGDTDAPGATGNDTQSWTLSKTASWAASAVEVNAAAVTTPTTDQLMRHGNWFNGGTEQGFFWVN